MSEIEWTDKTWNPTSGCDQVSPGCDHCYALTMAKRLKAMGQPGYQNEGDPRTSGPGFALTVHPERLGLPLTWRKPAKVFVNSMSDLFHKGVPDEFIAKVFAVMASAPRHTFQILTKRHARMRTLLSSGQFAELVWRELHGCLMDVPGDFLLPAGGGLDQMMERLEAPDRTPDDPMPALPNVWLGVSVEDQRWANIRIPDLLGTPAAVRWISAEPLLGPLDLTRLPFPKWSMPNPGGMVIDAIGARYGVPGRWQAPAVGLDWVVAGGESGTGARPMHPDWARSLRDQCAGSGVPFLYKQAGAWTEVGTNGSRASDSWVNPDGTSVGSVEGRAANVQVGAVAMRRVGKKVAGRELDGVTHDEYPSGPTVSEELSRDV